MRHVIRTQVFDVITNRKDEAFQLQQSLRDLFYETILPLLEKTFDELASDDEVILIDKLEIDLGRLALRDLPTFNWNKVISESIGSDFALRSFSSLKGDSRTSRSLSVAQQWLYYMTYGYLPWNTINTDKQWYDKVLEGLASEDSCIQSLRSLLSKNPNAVKRIVYLHDDAFLTHLIEALTGKNQQELFLLVTATAAELTNLKSNGEKHDKPFAHRAWNGVLRFIVESEKSVTPEACIKYIFINILSHDEVQSLLNTRLDNSALSPLLLRSLRKESGKRLSIPPASTEKSFAPDHLVTPAKPVYPNDSLFIANAGVVLLHPFLISLFTYLGLVRNQEFISDYDKQKALKVLHFLCTGDTNFEEHELVIHKILCDYPLADPVDPDISLSFTEQEECLALLKEVIVRWTILKNTSVEGLRVNFLQRSGKLYILNDEPHVVPEASVLDVLIDRLPWGVGIIKLPWMKHLLKVEWR